MLYLQSNPAIPEFVYIGKPIVFDPTVLPEPYVIMAEVPELALDRFEKYKDPSTKDGFYKLDIDEAMRIANGFEAGDEDHG